MGHRIVRNLVFGALGMVLAAIAGVAWAQQDAGMPAPFEPEIDFPGRDVESPGQVPQPETIPPPDVYAPYGGAADAGIGGPYGGAGDAGRYDIPYGTGIDVGPGYDAGVGGSEDVNMGVGTESPRFIEGTGFRTRLRVYGPNGAGD